MSNEQPDFWRYVFHFTGERKHDIDITSDSWKLYWSCSCWGARNSKKRRIEFKSLDLAKHEWFMHMMDEGGN